MRKRKEIKGTAEEICKVMKEQTSPEAYRRIQCVYLAIMYPDMGTKEIGKITQYSESHVWAIHAQYRTSGLEGLKDKRGGRYRENLTIEEERELLSVFEEQSRSGKLVVVRKIKLAYEEKVGKEVAESTVYRMLSRHGFRKIVPYKRHPKSNEEEQEAFKKTFRKQ
jgi:transposase